MYCSSNDRSKNRVKYSRQGTKSHEKKIWTLIFEELRCRLEHVRHTLTDWILPSLRDLDTP